ncbi:NAD(P)-binding protein [Ascobolus immersus RN42]|uniref:NAD(P)-binding protein n=1 Tax=Ascobolus immersus RN42 TaxID=1160509 RepID=A0A3N4IPV2_ASCIM|nr:NAD(P)-binding protein [Ascobolus immersus RN42]
MTSQAATTAQPFLVLPPAQLRPILTSLRKLEVETIFHHVLSNLAAHPNQPHRLTLPTEPAKTMIMPCANSKTTSVKHIVLPQKGPPTGSILLHDLSSGNPKALIDAKEVTALRTALASVWPVMGWWALNGQGGRAKEIVMFGNGKQVEYAIRLLRTLSTESHTYTIVVRSESSSDTLRTYLEDVLPSINLTFQVQPPESKLKELVIAADAIFCCTPSTSHLFDSSWISESKKKRFISLIGSYTPQMKEISLESFSPEQTRILLDHADSCYKESGELIDLMDAHSSGPFGTIWGPNIKSLTELFVVVGSSRDEGKKEVGDIRTWLLGNDGEVETLIYKGVGHATMDLGAAEAILQIVTKRGGGAIEVNW